MKNYDAVPATKLTANQSPSPDQNPHNPTAQASTGTILAFTCSPKKNGKNASRNNNCLGLEASSCISNLLKKCANDMRSSIHAKLMPKQERGPLEKATSHWSRDEFSSQRAGLNSWGLGKRVGL